MRRTWQRGSPLTSIDNPAAQYAQIGSTASLSDTYFVRQKYLTELTDSPRRRRLLACAIFPDSRGCIRPARRRQAYEKRQGTKSRDCGASAKHTRGRVHVREYVR